MGKIVFDESDEQNLVAGHYSTGRGPVLRSDQMELTKITFEPGKGAELHEHPEEQILYVLDGCFDVILGDDQFDVEAGQGVFVPSGVSHRAVAKQRTTALSFKVLVDPSYEKTGEL